MIPTKNAFAINTNTYHGFSADEALEGIAAAGFRYVEIAALRGWTEHILPEWPREEIERVKQKAKALGLEIIAMSGHCDLSDPCRLDAFRANMRLARELGCGWIISTTGETDFTPGPGGTEDRLIANLRALLPDLEACDLRLGIEVHGAHYGTGEAACRLAKAVDSPRIGVCYDAANAVFWSGVDPRADLRACLEGMNCCHLKDKIGGKGVWNFPALGGGELPLPELMQTMEDDGFEGPFSIEIEFTEAFSLREKRAEDLAYANRLVRESWDWLHAQGLI